MAKREYLQLAHTYKAGDNIGGWFLSEKLDGCRCLWDGGVSRGLPCASIPWANTAKDGRYVDTPIATGLWSRYGKRIVAPDWFLDMLPTDMLLDGELYMGRGRFQDLMSCVKKIVPDDLDWREVRYCVFDIPSMSVVFGDGTINNTNFKKVFRNCLNRYSMNMLSFGDFATTYGKMLSTSDTIDVLHQERLPYSVDSANLLLQNRLEEITDAGGEGLILRRPMSIWTPSRTHDLLKVKKLSDMEGVVVGYTAGKETALGSKLLGLMGSLRLQLANGGIFDLSGFTDLEREMVFEGGGSAREYLASIAGRVVDNTLCHNPLFLLGSRVTFRFRELTRDCLPKEARYWRKH